MVKNVFCMCPECNYENNVDTSLVLASDPPKYNYSCKNCGYVGYVVHDDLYLKAIQADEEKQLVINKKDILENHLLIIENKLDNLIEILKNN